MIHVDPQPEPADFDARVRQKGHEDLQGTDELRPHWRHCSLQLWKAYRGICAYSCLYIPRGTGALTVDHLLPKSKQRALAYEWSNYRLACNRMNARKNAFEDVLDPFEVQDGWFALELSTLQVIPGAGLSASMQQRVQDTIDRLDLNDEEFLEARTSWYDEYRQGAFNFDFLRRHFPFLAKELVRQGLVQPQ
ncbi:HNH endonuclease [Corallococcus exiguus]|uniref:HNH endonuclease n=1 Tax=Corallococcus exiguus TaxID=83462 RepID=UPI0014713A68|nr:hypothetical protein [Corallococcus exiguus]NNB90903.1 hypothetical protein [Corallococcus exiguus]